MLQKGDVTGVQKRLTWKKKGETEKETEIEGVNETGRHIPRKMKKEREVQLPLLISQ